MPQKRPSTPLLHDAMEQLVPATVLPRPSNFDCMDLAAEFMSMEHTFGIKKYNIEIHKGVVTLAALAKRLAAPTFDVVVNANGMPPLGHVLKGRAVHRFIRRGVGHYARIMPNLQINRAGIHVVIDTLETPYNPGGLTAHTDLDPSWDNEDFEPTDSIMLSAATCTVDPGTYLVRLSRPLDGKSPVGRLMQQQVRRNKGPASRTFVQAARHDRSQVTIMQAKAGEVSTFHGQAIHWRGTEDVGTRTQKRRFAALDLVVPITPRNRRIIQAALQRKR